MALFGRPRRAAQPEAGSPTSALVTADATAPADRPQVLASSPTLAGTLEPALREILEASGAQAGALCLFDERAVVLRLAAHVGLSDEGCQRLRAVGPDDPTAWDLPLRSLLDRRAYLIANAAGWRDLPALLAAGDEPSSLACVPLRDGARPFGTLILIALAPLTLAAEDLEALEPLLRELPPLVERVRPRASPRPPTEAARAPFATSAEPDARSAEIAELNAALTERIDEVERLRAALETSTDERSRLAAELDGMRREADRVKVLEASLAAAERERACLSEAIEAATSDRLDHARARAEASQLAAELLAVRTGAGAAIEQAIEAVRAERAAEIDQLHARLRAAEAASGGGQPGGGEKALLAARTGALAAEVTALRAENVSLRAAEDAARERAEQLASELERSRFDSDAAAVRAVALEAELNALRRVVRRVYDNAPREQVAPPASPAVDPGPGRPRERLRVVTSETPTPARRSSDEHVRATLAAELSGEAMAGEPGGAPRRILILDGHPAWGRTAIGGCAPTVVSPAGPVAERIAALDPGRVLVNLAAPGALAAMAAVRRHGAAIRFWGCLAEPSADRALGLRLVEAVPKPLDAEALVATLGKLVGRNTRIVAAGSDGEMFMGLRHALVRRGASVSIAWDAKQTTDLLASVHPHLVVLDLALPPSAGFDMVIHLAMTTPIPNLVLVYEDELWAAQGLRDVFRAIVPGRLVVPLDRLLADALAQSDVPHPRPTARPPGAA